MIVRSDGTVTYVGKDIAYQLWKFGLLGRDFGYRFWQEEGVWETAREGVDGPPAPSAAPQRVINVIDARQSYLQKIVRAGLAGARPRRGGGALGPLRLRDGGAVAGDRRASSASLDEGEDEEQDARDVGPQGDRRQGRRPARPARAPRAARRSPSATASSPTAELDAPGAADRHRRAALLHGQGDDQPGHRLRLRRGARASKGSPAPTSSTRWCAPRTSARRLREEGLADEVTPTEVGGAARRRSWSDDLWDLVLAVAQTGEIVEKGAETPGAVAHRPPRPGAGPALQRRSTTSTRSCRRRTRRARRPPGRGAGLPPRPGGAGRAPGHARAGEDVTWNAGRAGRRRKRPRPGSTSAAAAPAWWCWPWPPSSALTWFGYSKGKEIEAGFKDPSSARGEGRARSSPTTSCPGLLPAGRDLDPLRHGHGDVLRPGAAAGDGGGPRSSTSAASSSSRSASSARGTRTSRSSCRARRRSRRGSRGRSSTSRAARRSPPAPSRPAAASSATRPAAAACAPSRATPRGSPTSSSSSARRTTAASASASGSARKPTPRRPAAEADFTGTPADPQALRRVRRALPALPAPRSPARSARGRSAQSSVYRISIRRIFQAERASEHRRQHEQAGDGDPGRGGVGEHGERALRGSAPGRATGGSG